MNKPSKEYLEAAISRTSTMYEAAILIGMKPTNFIYWAKKFGIYEPTHPGHASGRIKIPLEEIIFEGKHPEYLSSYIKKRLIKEGYREHRCEICGLTHWNGVLIPLELNHKDGNSHNHLDTNLEIICPNCHAQDDNHRGKNKGQKYRKKMNKKIEDFSLEVEGMEYIQ